MNQLKIAYVLAAMLSLAVLNTPALAEPHHAKLVGFQEVPVVVTEGSGHFKMDIAPGDGSFDFVLSYEGIEGGAIQQAHVHVGQRNVNGGIVVFRCTNLPPPAGVPAPPPCPPSPGTLTGTRTTADVLARQRKVSPLASYRQCSPLSVTAGPTRTCIQPPRPAARFAARSPGAPQD